MVLLLLLLLLTITGGDDDDDDDDDENEDDNGTEDNDENTDDDEDDDNAGDVVLIIDCVSDIWGSSLLYVFWDDILVMLTFCQNDFQLGLPCASSRLSCDLSLADLMLTIDVMSAENLFHSPWVSVVVH